MDTETDTSSSSDDEMLIFVRRKIYRNREDCFNKYNDEEFFERFRLTKPTVLALLERIKPLITSTNRSERIQPINQVLLTLRFYATGSMLIAGDFMDASKTSACSIVKSVTDAIASLRPHYIDMYKSNIEMERAAKDFYNIASFPQVIGAIDCTLIKIQSPGGKDAEVFRCRKGYFSLNVQTVSDANLRIRNIVARFPGSTSDQFIFSSSKLNWQFEDGRFGQYMLVGDGRYTIKPYLMTKLSKTQTAAENLYNESIIRTRNVVERQCELLKMRFPILTLGVPLNVYTTMNVIVATAVLHNIAIEMNETFPDALLRDIEQNEDKPVQNVYNHKVILEGRNVRKLLIEEHFARLNII